MYPFIISTPIYDFKPIYDFPPVKQKQQSAWKKMIALAVGILSLTTSFFVAHRHFMHVKNDSKEIFPPNQTHMQNNFFANPLDSTYTPIPLCSKPDLWPEYEYRITKAINSCSATRKISELAKNSSLSNDRSPWRIKIFSKEESQISDAYSDYLKGELGLKCDIQEPTASAAFELINFCHQNLFDKLWEDVLWGKISSRDEYAEIVEEIEFNGTQIHHLAMEECIRDSRWKYGVQLWSKTTWENQKWYLPFSHHAERLRMKWDETIPIQMMNRIHVKIYELFLSIFDLNNLKVTTDY